MANRFQLFYLSCRGLLGVERNTTSHGEKLLSALGAGCGIALVYASTLWSLLPEAQALLLASMGASAVLLFAVPHGTLSQPWPLLGGHLLSALIGVTCQWLFPAEVFTAALAVCLAVGAMVYLRCIHPPGGATALAAVIGGPSIHELGFYYVLAPVLVNVLVLLMTAVVFNSVFPWRRYPAVLARRPVHLAPATHQHPYPVFTHEDFAAAMAGLNSYIDITAEDLAELFQLACEHAENSGAMTEAIIPGRFYSNGQLGQRWSIRQVIDAEVPTRNPIQARDKIIFKVLAGDGAYATGICRRDEFARWARFEVTLDKGRWLKV